MKMRGIVPIIGSLPFMLFGIMGVLAVGAHPLAIGLGLLGVISLLTGIYYTLWRITFQDGIFVTHPNRKEYRLEHITKWRIGKDTDAEIGHQRHLELRFDSRIRTYLLFEDDITPAAFDTLIGLLSGKENGAEPGATDANFDELDETWRLLRTRRDSHSHV